MPVLAHSKLMHRKVIEEGQDSTLYIAKKGDMVLVVQAGKVTMQSPMISQYKTIKLSGLDSIPPA